MKADKIIDRDKLKKALDQKSDHWDKVFFSGRNPVEKKITTVSYDFMEEDYSDVYVDLGVYGTWYVGLKKRLK